MIARPSLVAKAKKVHIAPFRARWLKAWSSK